MEVIQCFGDEVADSEIELIKADLQRFSLPGDIGAMVMKSKYLSTLQLTPPVLLLPVNLFNVALSSNGNAYHELLSIHLPKVIEHLRPQGPSLLLGYTLLSLSRSWRNYNSMEARGALALEAIQVFKQLKGNNRLGRAYLDLAIVFKDTEHHYDALYVLKLSEEESRQNRDCSALSAALYHRSTICRRLGQPIEALLLLDQAEEILKNIEQDKIWLSHIVSERIPNNIMLNRLDLARHDTVRFQNLIGPYFQADFYLGEIGRLLGDNAAALENYQRSALLLSIDVLENRTDNFQLVSRQRHDIVYQRGIECAINTNNPQIAFSLLQLSKTQGLNFLFSIAKSPGVQTPTQAINTPDTERLRQKALEALNSADQFSLDDVQSEAEWLIAELDRQTHSDEKIRAKDLDFTQIATKLQAAVPQDTLLLEFFTLEEQVWAILVTSDQLTLKPMALQHFDMRMLAEAFIHEREGLNPTDSLVMLANALLHPFAEEIGKKQTLIISPGDMLNGVPFHSMEINGKAIIETHTVTYVSSFLPLLKSRHSNDRSAETEEANQFLGVPYVNDGARPALPGVEIEARVFKKYFPRSSVIVDPPAKVKDLISTNRHKLLHVACHGEYDDRRPLLSRLLLADGPVFAFEIVCNGINANDMVITACRTAEGELKPGGYSKSMAAAFLKAGVKNILAAFWPVDDSAGVAFSEFFYAAYLESGSMATGLRTAQLQLRQDPRFAHPHFWAPFAVFSLNH